MQSLFCLPIVSCTASEQTTILRDSAIMCSKPGGVRPASPAPKAGPSTSIGGGDRGSLPACRGAAATGHMALVTPGAHQTIRRGLKGSQPKAAGEGENQRDNPGGVLQLTFPSALTPPEPHSLKDHRPRTGRPLI